MPFPIPSARGRNTADLVREEQKRQKSPGSFFYSQGQAQVLAAKFFTDDRLSATTNAGTASKHRHRIHLAMFGQLMASFEYFLKDFIAKTIDATPRLDKQVRNAKWLKIDAERVLANRSGMATVGSTLVHSTGGWHDAEEVNKRYQALFERCAFTNVEVRILENLWVLRHSVAHNAGMLIHYDAIRIGAESLSEKTADIDSDFIGETFNFLSPIAKRICGDCERTLLQKHFGPLVDRGPDYTSDRALYDLLKRLCAYTESRARDTPSASQTDYEHDFTAANTA